MKFRDWIDDNKTIIENELVIAADEFIKEQCRHFDVDIDRFDYRDLRSGTGGQWINLGRAQRTKHKDKCEFITDGITLYKNNIPSMFISFRCWQAGGQYVYFNGNEVVKEMWNKHKEDRNYNSKRKLNKNYYQLYQSSKNKKRGTQKKSFGLKILARDIELWHQLSRSGDSNYLRSKGFKPAQDGLFHDIDMSCRFGSDRGGQFIAVPVVNVNNKIKGLQKIYDNADIGKRFTYTLKSKGNFIIVGGSLDDFTGRAIRITEGYATGLTVHLATGDPVVCALNANNILPVAQNLRLRYKKKYILIHTDNDQWKEKEINPVTGKQKGNAGVTKAVETSKIVHATFYNFPSFTNTNTESKPTDFNDLFLLSGIEEVKKQLHYDLPIEPKKIKFHSPQEAQKLLKKHISEFMEYGISKAISFTTGGGKTQAIIEQVKEGKNIEIYEPTHAKCEEVAQDILARNPNIKIHIPKGRSAKNDDGEPMCKKHEAAEKLAAVGQRVYASMCHNGDEKCEFIGDDAFDVNGKLSCPSCPWLKQWMDKVDVRIMPHAYLQIDRSSFEILSLNPERIIIDESFHKQLLKTYRIPLLDLINSNIKDPIRSVIVNSMRNGLPLLKELRENNVKIEDIKDQIEDLGKEHNEIPISPSMTLEQQLNILNNHKEIVKFKGLLKSIGKEIELDRDQCISSEYIVSDHVEYIQIHYKKDIKRFNGDMIKKLKVIDVLKNSDRPLSRSEIVATTGLNINTVNDAIESLKISDMITKSISDKNNLIHLSLNYSEKMDEFKQACYTPLLIIDADADQEIIQKCIPHRFEMVELHCKDNIYVTQLSSASVSATSLKKNPELYLKVAANWAKSRIKEGKHVKIGGAQAYTGNPSKGIAPHPILNELGDRIQFTHFNGLRGLNKFTKFDCGITIGRNQPPIYAVENQAKSMYADDPEPLQLIGNNPMPKVKVAYRMRDESLRWAEVERHPDQRVQLLLEQIRESEVRQDIGRLRTVHHQGESKEYFIVTNMPIHTIIVDELVTTRESLGDTYKSKSERLVDHFFLKDSSTMVMPITDPKLIRKSSEGVVEFTSDEAARKLAQRIIGQDIIRSLLSYVQFKSIPRTITYRLKEQKGKSSKAVIACSYEQAKRQLEEWLGKKVIINEMVEYGIADQFFNSLELVDHQDDLFELIDETGFLCKDDDLVFYLLDNLGGDIKQLKHIVVRHVLEKTELGDSLIN